MIFLHLHSEDIVKYSFSARVYRDKHVYKERQQFIIFPLEQLNRQKN